MVKKVMDSNKKKIKYIFILESVLCVYIYIYIYVCVYTHIHTHTHLIGSPTFITQGL